MTRTQNLIVRTPELKTLSGGRAGVGDGARGLWISAAADTVRRALRAECIYTQALVTVAVRAHRGRYLDATCTSVRRAIEHRENTAARHIQLGTLQHSMDRAHGCDETSSVHCSTAWIGRTGVMKPVRYMRHSMDRAHGRDEILHHHQQQQQQQQ